MTEITRENFSFYRYYISRHKRRLWSMTRAKLSEITVEYFVKLTTEEKTRKVTLVCNTRKNY